MAEVMDQRRRDYLRFHHIAQNLNFDEVYKVILLGDSASGKTSLMLRALGGRLDSQGRLNSSDPTAGVDFGIRLLQYESDLGVQRTIKMQLWDTAGQEKYQAVTRQYFRRADGCIVVYDCNKANSLQGARKWVEEVRKYVQDVPIMLLGNIKSDSKGHASVSEEKALKLARELKLFSHVRVSVKTESHIDHILVDLAKEIDRHHGHVAATEEIETNTSSSSYSLVNNASRTTMIVI